MGAEYGHPWNTTEYVFARTRRELDWRLKAVSARIEAERSFQANLHGRKLENEIESGQDDEELSEAQQLAIDKAMREAQERKRKEFAKHG